MTENTENQSIEYSQRLLDADALTRTATEVMAASAPQERALLRILAVASQHDIDPTPLLSGFADESSPSFGYRIRQLNELISEGVDPVEAIDQIPGLLPQPSRLALSLARDEGILPGLYTAFLDCDAESEDSIDEDEHPFSKSVRLILRIWFVVAILTFIMLKIIPEFQKMFEEFGIELPAIMKLLMSLCDRVAQFWFLVPLFLIFLTALLIPALRNYLHRWNPLTWRQKILSPDVIQRHSLAMIARTKQSLSSGIAMILKANPMHGVSKRFSKASARMDCGQDEWESLATENVISRADAKALSLTASGETQSWLLRWSASQSQDRSTTRYAVLLRLVFAVVHIAVAFIVLLTCAAVFMSLISIMKSMS